MGYELERFIHRIDEEFQCSICKLVMEEPMQTPCDHLFCKTCITEWLAIDESCPVDRSPLKIKDLKVAATFVRSLLDKLEMRCDFFSEGCQAILRLEQLQNHIATCDFSPNSEILCDKGCKMKIRREYYVENDCFSHLACRITSHEKDITKLSLELSDRKDHFERMQQENTELNRQLSDQKDLFEHMRQENTELRYELNRQQEVITKLNDQVNRLHQEETSSNSNILLWRQFDNMQISQPSNILKAKLKSKSAFAQSLFFSRPNYYRKEIIFASFKVQILNDASDVAIGLTPLGHGPDIAPGSIYNGSVGYFSSGLIKLNNKIEKDSEKWKVSNTIECLIKHWSPRSTFIIFH